MPSEPSFHVVITGASSGIGEAIAHEYGRIGARLTLVARRRDRLEALAASYPGRVRAIPWDLSDPTRATDWIADAVAFNGPIDLLVNNAGLQKIGYTWTLDLAEADALLGVNLLSPLRLIRAVLPAMVERRKGTIVNIASVAAFAPTASMTYYNAAKGGLACASEALRGEVRRHGVRVLTVYPGAIDTDMLRDGLTRYGPSRIKDGMPSASSAALAAAVRRAVDKDKARLIYPRLNVLLRWFPGLTRWVLDNFTPRLAGDAS